MYIAVKHQRRKLRKSPLVYNEKFAPFISILIPCHNEACVIKDTIENILDVDYKNYEIIIIDDRSTDNTKEVISELEKKYNKVKTLISDNNAYPGNSAVVNDAVKIAKGEEYLEFDADANIKPDNVKKLLVKCED